LLSLGCNIRVGAPAGIIETTVCRLNTRNVGWDNARLVVWTREVVAEATTASEAAAWVGGGDLGAEALRRAHRGHVGAGVGETG